MIRLWDPLLWSDDRAALERRVCGALQRNLTRAEWAEYVPGQPYRETCPGAGEAAQPRNSRRAASVSAGLSSPLK